MHSVSMTEPDCLTSANTFSRFSVLILPERISANRKALWAEWTRSSSSSSKRDWALVSYLVRSIGSLTNMNSDRM